MEFCLINRYVLAAQAPETNEIRFQKI